MARKLSITQKITIFLALACYIGTLYSFLKNEYLLMIVFFILHSIALLYCAYMAFNDRSASAEMEDMADVIEDLEEEKEDIIRDFDDKLKLSRSELDTARSELQSVTNELESQKNTSRELEQKVGELDEVVQMTRNTLILPMKDMVGEEKREVIDIIRLAGEVVKEMEPFARKAGISLNVAVNGEDLKICADSEWIRIMFKNIIDNSIKYVNRQGVLVITISTIGDDIFIVLKDNGEGLPAEETNHVFELNYQGSNRISGNGLGLFQAKAIVDYYGGTIYAKSTPGNGMGIYIHIPASTGA